MDLLFEKEMNQILNHREEFSHKIFVFICIWSIFACAVLVFNGYELFGFYLDKSIIITLLTTTLNQYYKKETF